MNCPACGDFGCAVCRDSGEFDAFGDWVCACGRVRSGRAGWCRPCGTAAPGTRRAKPTPTCSGCGISRADSLECCPNCGTDGDPEPPTKETAVIYVVHHNYASQSLFASREAAEEYAAAENAKPVYAREPRYWSVEERQLRG